MNATRYAVKCIAKSGYVTYTYFCNADLLESTKSWAQELHPDCKIEVTLE